jgi:hypothetical protein
MSINTSNLLLRSTSQSKIGFVPLQIEVNGNMTHHMLAVDKPLYQATLKSLIDDDYEPEADIEESRFASDEATISDQMIAVNSEAAAIMTLTSATLSNLSSSEYPLAANYVEHALDVFGDFIESQQELYNMTPDNSDTEAEHQKNLEEVHSIAQTLMAKQRQYS